MLVSLTSFIIVFGATVGATGLSTPMSELKELPKVFKVLTKKQDYDMVALIERMKTMCLQVRKNGPLSLENQIEEEPESLMRKGMRLLVDGASSEYIRETMELTLEVTADRHRNKIAIFEAAGGFCPTMGITGTVCGLVLVLSNLSEPATLGHKIAVAFIATLYGVGFANLFFLPMANRLKEKNKQEILYKAMMIEGILLIQEGASTNAMDEKLSSFLSEAQIAKRDAAKKKEDK